MLDNILWEAGIGLDAPYDVSRAKAAAMAGALFAIQPTWVPATVVPLVLRRELERGLSGDAALAWALPTPTSGHILAYTLASEWDAVGGNRARLTLDVGVLAEAALELETVLEELMRYAVPDGSVTLVENTGPSGHWGWPLRIGVLPSSAGLAIAGNLATQSMVRRGLGRLVVLGVDAEDCDLLLLAETLPSAEALGGLPLTQPDGAIGATVVLGGGGSVKSISALCALRKTLSSDGVVLVHIEPSKVGEWADALLRELSHNMPFDVALRKAGGMLRPSTAHDSLGEHPAFPLLVTGPELLRYARLNSQMKELAARLRALPKDSIISLPEYVGRTLGLQMLQGLPSVAVADAIDTVTQTQRGLTAYSREGGAATAGQVVAGAAAAITEAADPTRRFADVTLAEYDLGQGGPGRRLADHEGLVAGQKYVLGIAFRQRRVGIGANDPRVPVATLDPAAPELLVTIAPRTERLRVPEPAQYLRLPKTGDSDEARFLLETAADAIGTFLIEIRVFDRLNLVESLEVSVTFGDASSHPAKVTQHVEHRELVNRVEPKTAHIHISRSGGDTYRIAVTIERRDRGRVEVMAFTKMLGAKQLEQDLGRVRNFWMSCALDRLGKTLDVNPKLREELTRDLAQVGYDLWCLLFRTQAGALEAVGRFLLENAPPQDAAVQITLESTAVDFVFPWALLHPTDPTKPDLNAFWGTRYVIEQQVQTTAIAPGRAVVPTGAKPFHFLFALYNNFEQSAAHRRMIEDFAMRSSGTLDIGTVIENPKELITQLGASEAGLIYVFSHGYTPFPKEDWLTAFRRGLEKRRQDPAAASILEVLSRGDFIQDDALIELTQGTLHWRELNRASLHLPERPIVFLNMCRSAQLMPGLAQSFVWLFLWRAQVRSVLGTECPVSPAFADLMGREILPRLLAGTPVGKALYDVRRKLFLESGNPLGLAYTLWGSAAAVVTPPVMLH
jgi:hypothetical protein